MRTAAPNVSLLALSTILWALTPLLSGIEHARANGDIQPGLDLFETPGGMTDVVLPPLPADFFGPGCEPFAGMVMLQGDPLDPVNKGSTDTIVERPTDAIFDSEDPQPSDTIPIEIISLQLVSIQPITVQCNGTNTLWDVRMTLSDAPQQQGSMTIQKTHPNGGTFTSELPVTPKFTFTETMTGDTVILDGGDSLGSPLGTTFGYLFQQQGAPWVFEQDGTCPGGSLRIPGMTSNMCASTDEQGRVKTMAQSGDSQHSYQPARQLVPVSVHVTKETRGGDDAFDIEIVPLNLGGVSTRMLTLDTRPDDETPHFADSFFDVFVDLDGLTGLQISEKPSKVYQSTKERCMFESIDPNTEQPLPCDFLNIKKPRIRLQKTTIGDDGTFHFIGTQDPEGNATSFFDVFLTTTPENNHTADSFFDIFFDLELQGNNTYRIDEEPQEGWTPNQQSCTVTVEPGQEHLCPFENTKRGKIIIRKRTIPPGDPQEFEFTGDVSGLLQDTESAEQEVDPGTYTSTEIVPDDWDLTSIVCNDTDSTGDVPSATATFVVSPNEVVTCVFTNTKKGKIIVEKRTNPPGDPQVFQFVGSVGGLLQDGQTAIASVRPGTYGTVEIVPAGWTLTSITCDDSDSTGNLLTHAATYRVAPGEIVTCTFKNTKHSAEAPLCNDQLATIYVNGANIIVGGPQSGLPYAGFLNGTPGDDVIVATDERDAVHGRGGNDTICTLDEDDRVVTLHGRDWIDLGEGDNKANAGRGDDEVVAGNGDDKIQCGPGTDTAAPGGGSNTLKQCEVVLP